MMAQQQHSAVLVDAPSPLVGEGITAGRHKLTSVRGLSPHLRMRREPLTRLRFAKPPSPTRGEGRPQSDGDDRMNTQLLIQLLVNGLVVGTLYGVVAMSFVLIYKATQVVNFAQGELLLVGAWVCWWLLTKYQVPFYLGMPITLVFMFLFGIAIQIFILRPMIGEPIISVIMVTIALSMVFSALMKWIFGVNLQPFPRIFQTQNINILGLQVQTVYLMSLAVSVAMMVGMAWFFRLSKYGLAMRATAFNQQVAQSLGISVKSVFAMAWAISATVSAVAGVVVAVVNGVSAGLPPTASRCFRRRSWVVSTASAARCWAASSSACWKTSRTFSTANICIGAISTRSRRSMR